MPSVSASRPIRTLEDAERFLEGLIHVERQPDWPYARFSLEPAQRLLERVGSPQDGLSVLHVAGSKGKGSTVLLAEAVLAAAGERVGVFTSPHLERWTQRFRIDGREVEGGRLAAAVERLRPHVDALRAGDPRTAPTFFDATTAAALLLFREARVDHALLEVGLGGRLDSTNVVDPAVSCVTSVELEHTDRLGTTLAAIAREKAGVIKPGRPAVAGALAPEAAEVVEARAREVGAPLAVLGREFQVEVRGADAEGVTLALRDGPLALDLRVPLLGVHHAANVALALACVHRLGSHSPARLAVAARGLSAVTLPGRVELLARRPWIVVDSAHTPASARALVAALELLPRGRRRLVLSISADKDLAGLLGILLPAFDEVFVTRADSVRSLEPAVVAAAARAAAPRIALHAVPNPFVAVRAAREGIAGDDLLCAAGSVYLAGVARRVLAEREPHPGPRSGRPAGGGLARRSAV